MRILVALSLALVLSNCNGNDADFNALLVQFAGRWDANYNLSTDECGLLESSTVGFSDVHNISQQDREIVLETTVSVTEALQGETREDNSFVAEEIFEGDLFGDGINCQLYQAISYTPTSENTASSLFVSNIQCVDGYECESRGLGESRRRE